MGRCAIILQWEKLPDGKSGPVERHGGVRLGDVLIGVNETPTAELTFGQVMALLKDDNSLRKSLHFCTFAELERRRGALQNPAVVLSDTTSRFTSRVRRARVAEPSSARHHRATSNFAEYEVVCALRLDATKVAHDAVLKWAVWRRYSDFDKTDAALRQSLGWRMNDVGPFPPKHHFVLDKLAPEFIEKRRSQLDEWWQKILSIDSRITDFHMHHCEPALKAFVDAETHLKKKPSLQEDSKEPSLTDSPESHSASSSSLSSDVTTKKKIPQRGRPVSLKSKRRLSATTTTKPTKVEAPPAPAPVAAPAPAAPAAAPAPAAAAPAAPPRAAPPPPPAKPAATPQVPAAAAAPRRNALMAASRAAA